MVIPILTQSDGSAPKYCDVYWIVKSGPTGILKGKAIKFPLIF